MVNSTFPRPIGIDSSLCLLSQHTWRRILPRPIGIDSPLCLLSQHTWRRILPRRCHLDRRRGGCCPATATGANPHHVRRRPERLNCCRPSPFSVACPVLPFVSLTLRYTRLFVQLSRAEFLIRVFTSLRFCLIQNFAPAAERTREAAQFFDLEKS